MMTTPFICCLRPGGGAGGTGGQRFERISLFSPSAGRRLLFRKKRTQGKEVIPCGYWWWRMRARLAQTLAELLRREGYTADVSNDGLSGLDNAASGIYDLVVLDAMLPGMDGFTLLQRLRQEGHTACRC